MATTYKAPEQHELLNIIKQLRDYIANPDIAPEDQDRLYQEHLALADSVLSHCAECSEDTDDEEEEIQCERCNEPVYSEHHEGKIDKYGDLVCEECYEREQYETRMFPDTEDEEEEDEDECGGFCFVCEKPLYDILQKTGTVNCSCESPCTSVSEFNRRSN